MDFLLILVLGAFVASLWNKVKELRASHADLEDRLHALEWRIGQRTETASQEAVRTRPADEAPAEPSAPEPQRPSGTVAQAVEEQASPLAEFEQGELKGGQSLDFEELFGGRLAIWAGGITIAIAGVFLVRIAIESGLMTPLVRVAASFVFGILLLIAAEVAHRFEARLGDPRVRQALAGAGLATLYAAF